MGRAKWVQQRVCPLGVRYGERQKGTRGRGSRCYSLRVEQSTLAASGKVKARRCRCLDSSSSTSFDGRSSSGKCQRFKGE
eukprot:6639631-Karenia_brevis.AAC.1